MEPTREVVKALQSEAAHNERFGAIMSMLSERQRGRGNLTIAGLRQKTAEMGGGFSIRDYEHVIQFLASLGLGIIQKNARGRITALTDIEHTLQSIGEAAIKGNVTFTKFKKKMKFKKLDEKALVPNQKPILAPKGAVVQQQMFLVVMVDGKPTVFQPTDSDVAAFLTSKKLA